MWRPPRSKPSLNGAANFSRLATPGRVGEVPHRECVSMGPRISRGLRHVNTLKEGDMVVGVSMGPRISRGLRRAQEARQDQVRSLVSMGPRISRGLRRADKFRIVNAMRGSQWGREFLAACDRRWRRLDRPDRRVSMGPRISRGLRLLSRKRRESCEKFVELRAPGDFSSSAGRSACPFRERQTEIAFPSMSCAARAEIADVRRSRPSIRDVASRF